MDRDTLIGVAAGCGVALLLASYLVKKTEDGSALRGNATALQIPTGSQGQREQGAARDDGPGRPHHGARDPSTRPALPAIADIEGHAIPAIPSVVQTPSREVVPSVAPPTATNNEGDRLWAPVSGDNYGITVEGVFYLRGYVFRQNVTYEGRPGVKSAITGWNKVLPMTRDGDFYLLAFDPALLGPEPARKRVVFCFCDLEEKNFFPNYETLMRPFFPGQVDNGQKGANFALHPRAGLPR